ncbi:hypothetical protein DEI93_00450 [Curtobacterium sp. MCBD17_035]|uniref:hypothetical protein n=1 Tax=Curtobacterium sp. MCBD17_035 TaxID=2175673 RepID=UPI0011B645BA|nr:hypothetical protein [Curtobacterium sp. MCBD17_035]WIB67540.1 hypothetical protein DEI93_00450 [Curtobacterium sp. MCBD17_035]
MDSFYAHGGTQLYGTPRNKAAESRTVRPARRQEFRFEAETARTNLRALEHLEANWDGYGAQVLSKAVRLNAWACLDKALNLSLVPDVLPTPEGTISFEWEIDEFEAHLQIGRTSYSMYIRSPDGPSQYYNGEMKEGPDRALQSLRRVIDERNGVTGASFTLG